MSRQLLKVKKVAGMLDSTEYRVYEMIRLRLIPQSAIVRMGRQIRVDSEALEQWIAQGGCAQPGNSNGQGKRQ
jgi:hypothetical protein